MKKQNRNKWISIICAFLIVIYLGGVIHYHNHFLPRTTILGTSIAGKNVTSASKTLNQNIKTSEYKFTENDKTVFSASQKELGIRQDFRVPLDQIAKSQNAWTWPIKLVSTKPNEIPNGQALLNKSKLQNFSEKKAAVLNENRQSSKSAQLSFKNGKLMVKKQFQGNKIAADQLAMTVQKSIDQNTNVIKMSDTYEKPQLTIQSSKFKTLKNKMEKIGKVSGTLKIYNDKTIHISRDKVQSWVKQSGTSIEFDDANVSQFLSKIDDKYGTYGKDHGFKSTNDGSIKVKGGLYGWTVNKPKQVAALKRTILNGQQFNQWIQTKGSGYHKNGTDIGNTYVEVDLKQQHEYYYKNGKLMLESAVVTGNPNKNNATPTGVYDVWSKQPNAILRGNNGNGTKYASHVNYWMPIDDTGVGLHDSPWQPKYGGNWYQSHGSHGCVNNPPAFMSKLFNEVSLGTPVIVH
ncbi:L,D-transpeptidase family protein [Paucilactobacillus sp. N302-9]